MLPVIILTFLLGGGLTVFLALTGYVIAAWVVGIIVGILLIIEISVAVNDGEGAGLSVLDFLTDLIWFWD